MSPMCIFESFLLFHLVIVMHTDKKEFLDLGFDLLSRYICNLHDKTMNLITIIINHTAISTLK